MARFFNKNIKFLRHKKGLSQEQLSKATGIERSLISRIENNLIETSIENVYILAQFFNIPISKLIDTDLTIIPEHELSNGMKLENVVLSKGTKLSSRDEEMIINMIERCTEEKTLN